MERLSQEQQVINQLRTYGEVSRNWCLQNYISRLGAIISKLQADGWTFYAHYEKTQYGRDYIYELMKQPELKLF